MPREAQMEQVRDVTHHDVTLTFLRLQLADWPLLHNLIHTNSYSNFKTTLSERLGPNPGWPQVAMMFRLTQTAVHVAGLHSLLPPLHSSL